MPCPTCYFPGNDPAATQCAQCGAALTPAAGAYPGSPVAYDVHPISDQGAMPPAAQFPPSPGPQFQPPPGPQFPPPPGPQFAAAAPYPGGPGQPAPGAYPHQQPPPQYPAGGYPQLPPVSGAPYPGMPVSPTPISVTPASGPPQPGYYQPLKPGRARVLLPLTVIVVVLVIASTVIAVVKLTGGSGGSAAAASSSGGPVPGPTTTGPGPGPTSAAETTGGGDPKAQAAAVDALLDASVASRTKLNAAIDLVGKCTLFDKAIADMQTVGTERQSQIDSVTRFDLSAIPEGEQVRSMLKESLGFSLAADRSYVPWGQAQQASGCGGGGESDYQEAQNQSKNATDAKTRFLGVWNPVASRYGLRQRQVTDI
ncbi:hypothetical protein ACQP2P_40340 [Dactylosporangium sp. CA-139114]|uniref:hypothetical protein n=1 Tax=Dactylosporangium sp. CA-139114 TaxID=3239931 RepID=UPI003D979E3D